MTPVSWATRGQTIQYLLPSFANRNKSCNRKFRSFRLNNKRQSTLQCPKLLAEAGHGIDETISEADLYRYTRHRWLKNEKRELAKRYVKFELSHLLREAVKVCKGAQRCTQVLKCIEGLHNKVFILTMDNGAEVVAKLPNPNAGPARYTTASEVATRQMLRDVFNIPIPRVLAWSCDAANNPVQAEYILEEKASGVRLGALWYNLPWATKLGIINQIADFDGSLCAVKFKMHGCVYFQEDLERLTGRSNAIQFHSDQQGLSLQQYAIGPLTKAELWSNGRELMDIDRGPWTEPQAYTNALGANETLWVRSNAKSRMNYYRSSKDLERPEDATQLLAKYEKVASYLAPASTGELSITNTLWHPDLHLDNVFVDPVSHKITGIVDWQSAVVAPLFYQPGVHRAFRHYKTVRDGWIIPEKPKDFDTLSTDEQRQITQDLESETIHKYYELQTMKRVPLHWDALKQPSISLLRKPVWLVTGAWENKDLFFLRDSLITLVAQWNEVVGEGTPCPIKFSTEELELHAKEEENMDGVGQMLSLFQTQGVLPADGMVQAKEYDIAVENCKKYKEVFLNTAQNEDERDLYSRLWPYNEDSE